MKKTELAGHPRLKKKKNPRRINCSGEEKTDKDGNLTPAEHSPPAPRQMHLPTAI